mgnify:FL=1
MIKLREMLQGLSDSVLPHGTLPVPEVQPACRTQEMVASRLGLAGAIIKCTGDVYLAVPCEPSALTQASKKIPMSPTGDMTVIKEYSEVERQTLSISSVMYNIITPTAAGVAGAGGITIMGLSARFRTVAAPSGLAEFQVSINGGQWTTKAMAELATVSGKEWLPWDGRQEQPPPIPVAAGVPAYAAAKATAAAANSIVGEPPAGIMRRASLSVMGINLTSSEEVAAFLGAWGEVNELVRPVTVALATAAAAPASGDGETVKAARAAAAAVDAEAGSIIDSIGTAVQQEVIDTAATFTGRGLVAGPSERGGFLAIAMRVVASRQAAAAAIIPSAHVGGGAGGAGLGTGGRNADIPLPGGDAAAIAAAVAAAMGDPAPDAALVEARRRIGSAGLAMAPGLLEQVIVQVAGLLRASPEFSGGQAAVPPTGGFTPAALPRQLAEAGLPFALIRPAGQGGDVTPAEVVAALAHASARTPRELCDMLATVAGRQASPAFFIDDPEYDAIHAAKDFDKIAEGVAYTSPEATWGGCVRRLRDIITDFSNQPLASAGKRQEEASLGDQAAKVRGTALRKAPATAAGRVKATAHHIISGLTQHGVHTAERTAVHFKGAIEETQRIAQTPYASKAIPFLTSDGSLIGDLPDKSECNSGLAHTTHGPT